MLSCDEVSRYLDAYADGELDNRLNIDMEEHLGRCRHCKSDLEAITAIKAVVRRHLNRPPLPEGLYERIEQALRLQTESWKESTSAAATTARGIQKHRYKVSLAAMLAIVVGSILFFAYRATGPVPPVYASAINDDHEQCWSIRQVTFRECSPALLSEELYARLGYYVNLNEIVLEGKTLLGGSICRFLGRKGAHVFLQDSGHHYSYFVFRSEGLPSPSGKKGLSSTGRRLSIEFEDGNCLVTWQEGDFYHVLVTDAPESAAQSLIL